MQTVFLFIFHHSHIADLLNTEYIKYLSSRHKVVVFLPKREGPASLGALHYYQNENIEYREQELLHEKWWYRFKLLRGACVRQFDFLLSVQVNYNREGGDRRRSFLRSVSRFLPEPLVSTRFFTWLEGRILPDEVFFREAVREHHPAIVLTATPGFTNFDAWAILLAKKHKIPTAAINFTWDNLTSNGKLIRKTDYLVVWNKIIKQEALDYHRYRDTDVFISGPLRFDPYFQPMPGELSREAFLREKGLDPARKTVLVGTMSDSNYPYHVELVEEILRLREENALGESFNVFVRVHPIDRFDKYERFIERDIPNFHVERAGMKLAEDSTPGQKVQMNQADMLNLKHTLKYCDLCINPFSTLSIEAMIFDKPVLNIGLVPEYRPALGYIHYKPLIDRGAVRVAYTNDDLTDLMKLYLTEPATDQEERKALVADYVGETDGLAYKRNADAVDAILAR